jgi:hypothetical protein
MYIAGRQASRVLTTPAETQEVAPCGFKGLILNLGHGLVKAGQVDAARVMYANARYASNHETWPYRDVLEAIASSDLDARAALYAAGANPNNAPRLKMPNRSCVYCDPTVTRPMRIRAAIVTPAFRAGDRMPNPLAAYRSGVGRP